MAQIISGIGQSKILTSLDTYNHTTLSSGMYKIALRVTDQPPSGLIINIQKNGSTIIGYSTSASTQSHIELQIVTNCAVSDVLTVIISSTTAIDTNINDFKATLVINQGSF